MNVRSLTSSSSFLLLLGRRTVVVGNVVLLCGILRTTKCLVKSLINSSGDFFVGLSFILNVGVN